MEYQKAELINNKLIVKFRKKNKDEFFELVGLMKSISGSVFNPQGKYWILPYGKDVINILKTYNFEVPLIGKRTLTKPFGKVDKNKLVGLRDFQIKGVEFLQGVTESEKWKGGILGDQMGLGKTITSLGYVNIHPEFKKILIICPGSIKLNWEKETRKWTDRKFEVIWGIAVYPLEMKEDKLNVIINYDILKYWYKYLISLGPWDLIIGDEGQYISNPKAGRTKAFLHLAKKAKNIIFLTGTPIRNYPKDFFTMLNLVDPITFFNRWSYLQRYCNPKHNGFGWTFKGATKTDELKNLIYPFLLRRKKEDVLKELPPKNRMIIPMKTDIRYLTEYNQESKNFKEWLFGQEKLSYLEIKSKLDSLKSLVYFAKRDSVISWIKDFLSTGDKLVVFAYHRKVIEDLYSRFGDVAVVIDGSVPTNKRQEIVETFQDPNNEVKLFIGQLKAAGVGITLTAASAVAFVELGWIPTDHEQAEDRIHRIGQKADSVFVYYLLAMDTLEKDVMELINEKDKIIKQILGDKKDPIFGDKEIIKDLLRNIYGK